MTRDIDPRLKKELNLASAGDVFEVLFVFKLGVDFHAVLKEVTDTTKESPTSFEIFVRLGVANVKGSKLYIEHLLEEGCIEVATLTKHNRFSEL